MNLATHTAFPLLGTMPGYTTALLVITILQLYIYQAEAVYTESELEKPKNGNDENIAQDEFVSTKTPRPSYLRSGLIQPVNYIRVRNIDWSNEPPPKENPSMYHNYNMNYQVNPMHPVEINPVYEPQRQVVPNYIPPPPPPVNQPPPQIYENNVETITASQLNVRMQNAYHELNPPSEMKVEEVPYKTNYYDFKMDNPSLLDRAGKVGTDTEKYEQILKRGDPFKRFQPRETAKERKTVDISAVPKYGQEYGRRVNIDNDILQMLNFQNKQSTKARKYVWGKKEPKATNVSQRKEIFKNTHNDEYNKMTKTFPNIFKNDFSFGKYLKPLNNKRNALKFLKNKYNFLQSTRPKKHVWGGKESNVNIRNHKKLVFLPKNIVFSNFNDKDGIHSDLRNNNEVRGFNKPKEDNNGPKDTAHLTETTTSDIFFDTIDPIHELNDKQNIDPRMNYRQGYGMSLIKGNRHRIYSLPNPEVPTLNPNYDDSKDSVDLLNYPTFVATTPPEVIKNADDSISNDDIANLRNIDNMEPNSDMNLDDIISNRPDISMEKKYDYDAFSGTRDNEENNKKEVVQQTDSDQEFFDVETGTLKQNRRKLINKRNFNDVILNRITGILNADGKILSQDKFLKVENDNDDMKFSVVDKDIFTDSKLKRSIVTGLIDDRNRPSKPNLEDSLLSIHNVAKIPLPDLMRIIRKGRVRDAEFNINLRGNNETNNTQQYHETNKLLKMLNEDQFAVEDIFFFTTISVDSDTDKTNKK